MSLALKVALGPLLFAQALRTRRRLPKLPEADGPRSGAVGRGRALSLLVLGDSSAAGVGVETQEQALAMQLARSLAARAKRRVQWQLRARSGVTTAQAMALLQEAPLHPAEVAVIVTGVNDVTDQVPPERAIAAREALCRALRDAHGVRHLVLTPVPPMQRFAGLPQPLRWIAGRDAAAHDRALAVWASVQHDVSHLPFDLPLDAALLARDGFHPGAEVYRAWGQALAEHIAGQVLPRLSMT
ncbi:SGNH/GDSL hydrolase family protein [Aquincola sp. S2]|uniref:SGNH/GDSL hydrolase family protein n=1 Tax=Pseudaquabacterium terrae TaxID=2732868 RepID=A0ABX2ESH2_9BURK|nr:SGNH/GDSL hydrolase family protein [Aquabacterium terrae]NRF71578.1 SGNH/GDSL hydrolase family protein [Aquabacterium terrae]